MTSATGTRDRIGSVSEQALERLIYVVGSARGGTTLTKNVIGMHDNVISFIGPSHFLNQPWRHRKRVDERLWRVIFWLPVRRDEARASLTEDRKEAYIRHLNQALDRKDFRELYLLYPIVQALDPDGVRDPGAAEAWLDKGNDFWGVDLLPRHFPQARFVFVMRDPRAAVASLAKRIADARPDTAHKVEARDVITSAIYWRNLAQQELRFARRYPSQTVFLRYEDLVTSPFTVIPRLYDFLGLSPMPEDKLRNRLANMPYGASLDSNERGAGLSTKPLGRWRKSLSTDAAELVAAICEKTAQRLGYDIAANKHHQIRDIAGSMTGMSERVATAAKLAYLDLREIELHKMTPSSSPPLRLLNLT
jgi:hypothetical protein